MSKNYGHYIFVIYNKKALMLFCDFYLNTSSNLSNNFFYTIAPHKLSTISKININKSHDTNIKIG